MSRSWTLFLRDMVDAASKVARYTAALDRQSFFSDDMAYDATVRNLFILGEASKGIPAAIQEEHPEIDWRSIAGLRNVLAHAYFAINETTLWEIVRERVPLLLTQLQRIVAEDAAGEAAE